jgi:hypothetical protein
MSLTSNFFWRNYFKFNSWFLEKKSIQNSINFVLLVPKLQSKKHGHDLVKGFLAVEKTEQWDSQFGRVTIWSHPNKTPILISTHTWTKKMPTFPSPNLWQWLIFIQAKAGLSWFYFAHLNNKSPNKRTTHPLRSILHKWSYRWIGLLF